MEKMYMYIPLYHKSEICLKGLYNLYCICHPIETSGIAICPFVHSMKIIKEIGFPGPLRKYVLPDSD